MFTNVVEAFLDYAVGDDFKLWGESFAKVCFEAYFTLSVRLKSLDQLS